MEIGVGIPSTIPGSTREHVLESAVRADALGFSSLGTIDRLVYPNYEPLIALAAAAAVTERIKLATAVLIVPFRQNAKLLAKQAASIQELSKGRLVLGCALGARGDDYEASDVPTRGRGARFEAMLEEMEQVWRGDAFGTAGGIGPALTHGQPEVILGGSTELAFRRAARFGTGWMAGGSTAEGFAERREQAEQAWKDAGRTDRPKMMAMAYCALGADAEAAAHDWIHSYYAFAGPYADVVTERAAKSEVAIKAMVQSYEDAGCDELILFPSSPEADQVERLAEVVL